MDEIAWQLEYSVQCDASAEFAWSYITQVSNLDDPPARFMLDGTFKAGSRGTTHVPGQAPVLLRIQDVRVGQSYLLATELGRATLSFEWRFDAPGSGAAADECGIRRWLLASEGAGRAARVTV